MKPIELRRENLLPFREETLSRLPGLVPGVAQLLQIAAVAFGLARDAYLAAVVDQLM